MPIVSPAAAWLGALLCAYFAFIGTHSPYLSLYYADQGMSVAQIGILMTVPQALRIVAPPFWGWWADHVEHPVRLVRAALAVVVVGCVAFFFTHGFYAWLALFVAMFFFSAATGPITEGLLMREVAGDTKRFGRVRVWGSVGFIAAVAAVGPLLDTYGLRLLPWMMLLFAVASLAAAMRMRAGSYTRQAKGRASISGVVSKPAMRWFLASAFWMIFAHAALYTLYSLYLEQLGFSKSVIGFFWALGVLAEIALFWWQQPLFERFSVRALLLASFAITALRFVVIAAVGDSFLWLAAAQLLHAVTFGVHHSASMKYLHDQFGDAGVARAMSLYTMTAYGFGATVGGLFYSWLWSAAGSVAIFWAAALAGLLGLMCCWRMKHGDETA